MKENAYDVTIIGAGPVGMFATFYSSLRQLKVKLIDALPELGGQLQALYPEKYIYDIPGYPEIKAKDLVTNLKQQIETVEDNVEVVLNERVEYVRRCEDGLFEICTDRLCHYTKTIIITAGKGAFQPRTLGIENEEQYLNIHYFVKDMEQFRDKNVAIFGGGDSAVDWANMLQGVAKEVNVIHRRNEFRAHEHGVEQMMTSGAKIWTPYNIESVETEESRVKQIVIKNDQNELQTLEVDDVIVLFGFLSALGPIETWDLSLDNKSLVVDRVQETNIKGIYAAGDACTYEGKVKMITCGFGEATVAVNQAYGVVNPNKKNAPVFSSALKKQR